MIRKFGPKPAGHPSVGQVCPGCKVSFKEGDHTALVVIGPGADEDARRRCREGRPYNAVAVEAHYACVTGHDDQETETTE